METALVRARVAEVERRTGRSFAAAFRAQDVTDFLFYLAWICSRGDLEDFAAERAAVLGAAWVRAELFASGSGDRRGRRASEPADRARLEVTRGDHGRCQAVAMADGDARSAC